MLQIVPNKPNPRTNYKFLKNCFFLIVYPALKIIGGSRKKKKALESNSITSDPK